MEVLVVVIFAVISSLVTQMFIRRKTAYGYLNVRTLNDDGRCEVDIQIPNGQNIIRKKQVILYVRIDKDQDQNSQQ